VWTLYESDRRRLCWLDSIIGLIRCRVQGPQTTSARCRVFTGWLPLGKSLEHLLLLKSLKTLRLPFVGYTVYIYICISPYDRSLIPYNSRTRKNPPDFASPHRRFLCIAKPSLWAESIRSYHRSVVRKSHKSTSITIIFYIYISIFYIYI
jgi:hypothetical protein